MNIAWASKGKKLSQKKPQMETDDSDSMEKVDHKFAIAFPVIFIIFNIMYWSALVVHKYGMPNIMQ